MRDDQKQLPGRGDDMPVSRVKKHQHNYIIIDKSGITDTRLSLRARGMLAYFLTKPDDWEISIRDLVRHTPEGREALTTAMRELEAYGYAIKTLQRDEMGRLRGYVTTVYETPDLALADADLPRTDEPSAGNPTSDRSATHKEYKTTQDLKKLERKKENTHPPPPLRGGAVAGSSFSAAADKTRDTNSSSPFERWWQTYPDSNRVAKKDCAKTWRTKHLDQRLDEIITHTEAMKRTKQWQEGKIPNTTKYLNQERYDTPPPEGAASSGTSDALMAQLVEIEREALDREARDRKAHP